MNKIIAVFDGLKFSESTLEYALFFTRDRDAHLVGVFLDDRSYTSYKIFELIDEEGVSTRKQKLLDQQDDEIRQRSRRKFTEACQKANIDYTIHEDRDFAIGELLHESIYADVLLIGAHETMTHYEEKPPTRFLRQILTKSHCPVVVLPPVFAVPGKLVLLYDGTPSSVHAIKMFNYIFNDLKSLPIGLLSVNNPGESLHLQDNRLMKELMKRHFPDAAYKVLTGDASEEILQELNNENQTPFAVLGAYGRSKLSRVMDESMADRLMKNLPIPLFISHY